jgi:pimeloyl-ACP methyl ester carboxylesterase
MDEVESRRVQLAPAVGEAVSVRYLKAGSGPPVVLVHGIGLDAAAVSWRAVGPALAQDRTVYALDLPGHGESDKPDAPYTTAYFQSVLTSFLAREGLLDAPLVGTSMGGAVALGYALEGPTERLALLGSYGLGGDAYWRPAATAALRLPGLGSHLWAPVGGSKGTVRSALSGLTGGSPDDTLVEDVYRAVSDPAVRRAMQTWQRSEFQATGLWTDYTDRLAEFEVPTLLIHGSADPLLPASWSRRAHRELPHSCLQVLEGCGHWPARERSAEVTRLLRAFLDGRGGPASD